MEGLAYSKNSIYSSALSITKEGCFYRFVYCSKTREKGFEEIDKKEAKTEGRSDNVRFAESIARSKSIVRQYARCNEWEYFFTFTVDPKKWDSFILASFYKKFAKMINNLNYRRTDGKKLIYMIIPEQHKSGAWHLHGLLAGFPDGEITENKHGYMDWPRYSSTFGFCSLSEIRDADACALYITKYVTKEALQTPLEKGEHFVLASKGLRKGQKVLSERAYVADIMSQYIDEWDYVSEDGNIRIKTIKEGEDDELLHLYGL